MKPCLVPVAGLCAMLLAACAPSADELTRADLLKRAAEAQAEDLPLASPLDTRVVALLTYGTSDRAAACDGYCMRLLYETETEKVLVGALIDDDDAAKLPKSPLTAFFVARGALCAAPNVVESPTFREDRRDHDRPEDDAPGTPTLVGKVQAMARAGLCLREDKASLSEATSVIGFHRFIEAGDAYYGQSRIVAFRREATGFRQAFRVTAVQAAYVPSALQPVVHLSSAIGANRSVLDDSRTDIQLVRDGLHILAPSKAETGG